MKKTIYRTCNLCEALCGLQFEVEDNNIIAIGSDKDDVFSAGYACPKGIVLDKLASDPDRLRQPMRRQPDGSFAAISWDEAFDLVERSLKSIRKEYGNDAVAFYQGNPSGHQHGSVLGIAGLQNALNTKSQFNASSQDTNPRFAISYYLYGASLLAPIPDVDRTSFFLCVGANPLVSNGSIMTAPNMRRRISKMKERGARVVVIDPCKTATAEKADLHLAVKPGSDAILLLSMLYILSQHAMIDEKWLTAHARGWAEIKPHLSSFDPKLAASICGVDADVIEQLALDFANAESAVCYTRVGVCLNEFSTLATWAGDLLNIVTGNLGRVGGAMFPIPPIDLIPDNADGLNEGIARWGSRVRDLPEVMGVLPTTVLAEEIETPGEGQIHAFVTLMGNPVLSVPNGKRISKALQSLDFMVCIDAYINETTQYADVILPSAHPLTQDYISILYPHWSVRQIARWSPPVLEQQENEKAAWEIMMELSNRLGGGATGNVWMDRLIKFAGLFGFKWHPTRLADLLLRLGPFGDRFNPFSKGLSIKKLREAPHGIDLGPLEVGFLRRILHQDKKLHLAPQRLIDALINYAHSLDEKQIETKLLLIGRRELRSNNSWMHNVPELMTGGNRCRLWVNPADAMVLDIQSDDEVIMSNHLNAERVPVYVTDAIRSGVVSLPHGYGHKGLKAWQQTASKHAGVSINDWMDDQRVEAVVAQSILNGVEVELIACNE